MIKIFISYSHADEQQKDRLVTHLTMLKRQEIVEAWHDRRLLAGADVDDEIDLNLLESQVVLLLVSADFLASNYCYCKELEKALELKAQGKMHIVPIILNHCDWMHPPISNLLAIPKDGKPIADFTNPDEAYTEVVGEIREVATSLGSRHAAPTPASPVSGGTSPQVTIVDPIRSSNLGIRRQFTDRDKDRFRKDGFEYISRFFKNSLEELEARYSDVEGNFEPQDANSFVAKVYRNGSSISQCLIYSSPGERTMLGDIAYTTSMNRSSASLSLGIDDDGTELFFTPLFSMFNNENQKLTPKAAAEHLWESFIAPLQQ